MQCMLTFLSLFDTPRLRLPRIDQRSPPARQRCLQVKLGTLGNARFCARFGAAVPRFCFLGSLAFALLEPFLVLKELLVW